MICFRCNNETEFEVKEVDVQQLCQNGLLTVKTPVTICKRCGWQSLDVGQTSILRQRVKDKLSNIIDDATDYSVGY